MLARTLSGLILSVTVLACWPVLAGPHDEWTHYGGSQHGLQYSSLSQITPDNVDQLEVAWLFRTGELGQGHREPFAFQANPILVEGRLYLPTGSTTGDNVIAFALP